MSKFTFPGNNFKERNFILYPAGDLFCFLDLKGAMVVKFFLKANFNIFQQVFDEKRRGRRCVIGSQTPENAVVKVDLGDMQLIDKTAALECIFYF